MYLCEYTCPHLGKHKFLAHCSLQNNVSSALCRVIVLKVHEHDCHQKLTEGDISQISGSEYFTWVELMCSVDVQLSYLQGWLQIRSTDHVVEEISTFEGICINLHQKFLASICLVDAWKYPDFSLCFAGLFNNKSAYVKCKDLSLCQFVLRLSVRSFLSCSVPRSSSSCRVSSSHSTSCASYIQNTSHG